ncbi:DNA repair protein RecO [bacterium]|nr:DNA repair protein RecO [bacterium]
MKPTVKKGLLIGRTRYKESSLIIRTLMEDGSLVSLLFKGALRRKSGIAGRIRPFALLEFVYYHRPGKNIYTASDVEVLEDFSDAVSDYTSQQRVAKFFKKAVSLIKPEQSVPEIFDIVLALLREWKEISSLSENLLWSGFLLKIMTFAGFSPTIFRCAICGGKINHEENSAFSPSAGGLICSSCRKPNDAIQFSKEMVKTAQFLLSNSFTKYFKIMPAEDEFKKLNIALQKFWEYHIGEEKS